MSFKQNMDGVKPNSEEATSRDLVPKGIHWVVVERVKETTTKTANRFPMVKVMFRVTASGEAHGMVQWDNIVFCEGMKGRNKHILKVLEQEYDGEDLQVDPHNWEGQELRIKVVHETYNNKPISKISQYLYKEDKDSEQESSGRNKEEESKLDDEEIPF